MSTTPATVRQALATAIGDALGDTWRESVFTGLLDLADGAGLGGALFAVVPAEGEFTAPRQRRHKTGLEPLQMRSQYRVRLAYRLRVDDPSVSMDAFLEAVAVVLVTGLAGYDEEDSNRPRASRVLYSQDRTWIMGALTVDVPHALILPD